MPRPTDAELEWASAAAASFVVEPGPALKAQGVRGGDPLGAENLNYLLRGIADWIEHFRTPQAYKNAWVLREDTGWTYSAVTQTAIGGVPAVTNALASNGLVRRPLVVPIPEPAADFGAVTISEFGCLLRNIGGGGQLALTVYRTPLDGSAGPSSVASQVFAPIAPSLIAQSFAPAVVLDPDYAYEIELDLLHPTPGDMVAAQPYLILTRAPGEQPMPAASKILTNDNRDPGARWVLIELTDNGADDPSVEIPVPRHFTLKRIKWRSSTGTVLPRLVRGAVPDGDVDTGTTPEGGLAEVCAVPGAAAQNGDREVSLTCRAPDQTVKLHPQGTGTGRTVYVELYLYASWRA